MTADVNRQSIERMMQAFNRHDPEAARPVIAPDYVEHELLECGATRLRLTGTHQGEFKGLEPTHNRIDLEVVDFLSFDGEGRITAHWGYLDRMEVMQQLGVLAPTG